MMACKNWNESRRGDAVVNGYRQMKLAAVGALEDPRNLIDPATGKSNFAEFRKTHMKEDWIRVETHETGEVTQRENLTFESTFDRRYLTTACNHCHEPACARACPQQIIYKEEDIGIVQVNNENCISCGDCLEACPWDVPTFYDPEFSNYDEDDPARPRMTKCTLCKDRISEGLKPACVAACWNRALDAGPVVELVAKYGKECVKPLPEFRSDYVPALKIYTRPNILFKPKSDVQAG
jgi:anaerobic dimethyl sulfoxide reductase subunit B (iron-sulfur subunit)